MELFLSLVAAHPYISVALCQEVDKISCSSFPTMVMSSQAKAPELSQSSHQPVIDLWISPGLPVGAYFMLIFQIDHIQRLKSIFIFHRTSWYNFWILEHISCHICIFATFVDSILSRISKTWQCRSMPISECHIFTGCSKEIATFLQSLSARRIICRAARHNLLAICHLCSR